MSSFSKDDRRALLELAREAVTAAVTRQTSPPIPPLGSDSASCGVFVSLHLRGRLRGCIGVLEGAGSLAETVARCAVSAALEDPRFEPLTAVELAELEFEVSVLSALRTATPDEVEPGRHGLRVRQGDFSGLLLPQVATRYHWSRERFLEETCNKAGLPADAWRDPATQIEVFTAEVFAEAEFAAEKKMPAGT
ncbi:MAG: AmmeMemoRadiSam system protein A [Candidatus Acidiferrales bacterium]